MNNLQCAQKWRDNRKGKITGSRIGAILNDSSFQSRDDVMREMVREWFDLDSEFETNEAVEWGKNHENKAIIDYEQIQGNFVESTGFWDYRIKGIPMGVSPDGLVDKNGLVEVKCPWMSKYTSIDDKPQYYHQIQLQLLATNRKWCDFFIWKPKSKIIERIEINPEWINNHESSITQFHEEFLSIIKGSKKSLKPFFEPLKIDQSSNKEWLLIENEYVDLKKQKEKIDAMIDDAREKLIKLSHDKKCIGDNIIMFKVHKNGTIQYKQIVKDYLPNIDVSQYKSMPSTYWSIRIHNKK